MLPTRSRRSISNRVVETTPINVQWVVGAKSETPGKAGGLMSVKYLLNQAGAAPRAAPPASGVGARRASPEILRRYSVTTFEAVVLLNRLSGISREAVIRNALDDQASISASQCLYGRPVSHIS